MFTVTVCTLFTEYPATGLFRYTNVGRYDFKRVVKKDLGYKFWHYKNIKAAFIIHTEGKLYD